MFLPCDLLGERGEKQRFQSFGSEGGQLAFSLMLVLCPPPTPNKAPQTWPLARQTFLHSSTNSRFILKVNTKLTCASPWAQGLAESPGWHQARREVRLLASGLPF